MITWLQLVLLLQYPLTTHIATLTGTVWLQLGALLSVTLGILLPGLMRPSAGSWTLALVIGGSLGVLALTDQLVLLTRLAPVALPLLLLGVFAVTLLPGREPLVTAIGEAARGPLSVAMRRYTRGVTWLWTLIFALLVATAAILPFTSAPGTWSWVTNVATPLLVTGVFVGEFVWRKVRFPDHDHPSFLDYLAIVRQARRR